MSEKTTARMRLPEWVLDDATPEDLVHRYRVCCTAYATGPREDQLAAMDEMGRITDEAERRGVRVKREPTRH